MRAEIHSVYMEQRALAFLRSWPDVQEGLRPAYSRIMDAGLLWLDPNVDDLGDDFRTWPGGLRLTEAGEKLRERVCRQSYNLFSHKEASEIGGMIVPESDTSYDSYKSLWRDPVTLPPVNRNILTGLKASLGRLAIAIERNTGSLK